MPTGPGLLETSGTLGVAGFASLEDTGWNTAENDVEGNTVENDTEEDTAGDNAERNSVESEGEGDRAT